MSLFRGVDSILFGMISAWTSDKPGRQKRIYSLTLGLLDQPPSSQMSFVDNLIIMRSDPPSPDFSTP